jgi:hypothetical protein
MSHQRVPKIDVTFGTLVIGTAIGWHWPGASSIQRTPSPTTPPVQPQSTEAIVANAAEPGSIKKAANFDERVKAIFATGNRLKRKRAVATIADGLDVTQIREALVKNEKIHGAEQREIKKRLYLRWGEIDPETAFEYARNLKEYDLALGPVTKGWAAIDLNGARSAVEKMSGGTIRKQAARGLIEALTEIDPRQAFELAAKLEAYSESVEAIFKNWVERNPVEAAACATNNTPNVYRRDAIEAVARAWAETDLPRAFQWLESLPEKDTIGVSARHSPLALILARWMDDDPDAAIRWIEERPPDSQSARLLADVGLKTMYQTRDPLLSAKIISMLPLGESKTAWNNLMYRWWYEDPEGAIDWVESQAEDVQRDVLPAIAWELGERDPERALKIVAKLGDKGAKVLDHVIAGWANRQPAAAAEWLRGQPANPEALASVAFQWVQRDAAEAAEWINSVEEGPAKDRALSQVAERFASSHPEIAVEWIAAMRDAKARNEAYDEVVDFWIYVDPAAARKWLTTASLPEDMKTGFLKRLNK